MIACPDSVQWRAWLDGAVDDASRADLAAHLETCTACQRLLDDVAGTDRTWADLAREVAAAPPEPKLARALNELKDRPSVTMPADADYPAKIDAYDILGEVGRGGMGVVLKAFDTRLHRIVAIKRLAPHLAANGAARERFLREARAAAAVAHEHVVTIHAVEQADDGTPYIVMQYVPGRSLQDRLDKEGRLELKEILRIGMQAAAGLEAAHAQGIVHRDVKPANFLLENGVERVKLADFGLARAADDASLTASGVLAGSPMFMSPEQAVAETVDQRSDLFALGAVLYTMAAGHPPFRASTPLAVLKRVCEENPRPLRQVNGDLPEWFEAIVARLMAKRPADRFATAAEVADLLGRHLRYLQHPDAPMPGPIARSAPGSAPSAYRAGVPSQPPVPPAKPEPRRSDYPRLRDAYQGGQAMVRHLWDRWRAEPETALMAYVAFALLLLGVLAPSLCWFFIPVSYVVSRATLATARGRREDLGARRWFIYPSLLIVSCTLFVIVMFGPPFVAGVAGYEYFEYKNQTPRPRSGEFWFLENTNVQLSVMVSVAAAGFWWMVVGIIVAAWPGLVHATLPPAGDAFRRRHAFALIGVGLALVVIAIAVAVALDGNVPRDVRVR